MKNKCVLPFISHDYQVDSPCCVIRDFKKESMQELLSDHNQGIRSRFCSLCWKTEDEGGSSKRLVYNKIYAKYLGLSKREVKISVIPTGNLCNLYCVVCHPDSSTAWWKKAASMYPKEKILTERGLVLETDVSQINQIKNLEHVEFIGGETLKSFPLWKALSEMKKTTSFSLQTNGTVILNNTQIELLKSFNKFDICFSIDGYGKIFEYIRQPAKWKQVQDNVLRYIDNFGRDKLSIYLTVSNLNILYIDDIMMELFKLLPTKIELNFVHDEEFNYTNLPKHVGKTVEKLNPGFFKKRKIEWTGTEKSMLITKQNLEAQDKFTGLKKENFLPELFDLLEKTPD